MSSDEFSLIKRFFDRPVDDPDVLLGIGDDAAVLRSTGALAVAVDTLVAGAHFPFATPAAAIGHRALAVNLSDLAAMGAQPRWCTLALSLPEPDEPWLAEFAAGFFKLADAFKVSLVGGDLTRGPLTISVQVIGAVAGGAALTRAGARPGDDLFVTGSLGDSAAGLARFQNDPASADTDPLAQRFLWPQPRVAAGLALLGLASACIDISDGLLADLGHVCERSGCRGWIEAERLPLSAALQAAATPAQARQFALAGGDDYELLFAAAGRSDVAMLSERLGVPVSRIGGFAAGTGTAVTLEGRPVEVTRAGYNHFQ